MPHLSNSQNIEETMIVLRHKTAKFVLEKLVAKINIMSNSQNIEETMIILRHKTAKFVLQKLLAKINIYLLKKFSPSRA